MARQERLIHSRRSLKQQVDVFGFGFHIAVYLYCRPIESSCCIRVVACCGGADGGVDRDAAREALCG